MKPMRSMQERVSEAEWDLRVNLAACYRLVAKYGMTDLIYNHITARVPGPEHHILISAYGMLYEEVTASSLIKVDLAGNIIEKPDHGYSVNAAGYIIHSAIHEAREDAQCVIHTHTPAGISVSAMEEGLLPLSQTAMRFHQHVAYHDPAQPRPARLRAEHPAGFQHDLLARAGLPHPGAAPLLPAAAAPGEARGRGADGRGALRNGDHARQRSAHQSQHQGRRAEGGQRLWPARVAGSAALARSRRSLVS
jgi:class II aldolase/adducin N-terminal domain-containing protein